MTEHTVWWWDDRAAGHMPVPMAATYDSDEEAVAAAEAMVTDPPPWLAWVRVFRADNENYEVFQWKRPTSQHPIAETPGSDPSDVDRIVASVERLRRQLVVWMALLTTLMALFVLLVAPELDR
jgi:hypothetical protein